MNRPGSSAVARGHLEIALRICSRSAVEDTLHPIVVTVSNIFSVVFQK